EATAANSLAVQGISLQYCTTAAGNCQAPGDNQGDADIDDDGTVEEQPHADNTRETNADAHPNNRSDLEVVGTFLEDDDDSVPLYDYTNDTGGGDFTVYVDTGTGFQPTSGWVMEAVNAEDPEFVGADLTPSTEDDA